MNNVIQTVGAFAGLVSLIAVAVLAMLNFSMARDLRRLREWAGGAPERDSQVRELSEIVAKERSEEIEFQAEREARRSQRGGYSEPGFWSRMGRSGRIMMILAGVLLVGTAAAWAGTQWLGGSDDAGKTDSGTKEKTTADLKPSQITVGVLNGTGGTESGLAATYGAALDEKGFSVGEFDDAPEVFTESIVMYSQGNKAAAKKVAKALGIGSTGAMTPEVSTLTPGAMVTAVIGTDHGVIPSGG